MDKNRFNLIIQRKFKYIERILLVVSVIVIFIQFQIINLVNLPRISVKILKLKDLNTRTGAQIIQGSCKFPKLSSFHSSFHTNLNETLDIPNCEKKHPLLFKIGYDAKLVALKNLKTAGYRRCIYCQMLRDGSGNDDSTIISNNCVKIISSSNTIKEDFEYIAVKCEKFGSKRRHLIDIFAVVRLKSKVQTEMNKQRRKLISQGPLNDQGLNVIVLGIDSVSHMAFLRNMKKTSNYLIKELNAIGMNGYTKHGDNTFENIVSVLTGKSVNELRSSCWKKVEDQFDKCPFIWKKFSEKGYITSYLEDDPQLAAFNSVRNGFKNRPVDYYLRPANLALFKHLGHTHFGAPTACLGPRLSFDVSLDYLKRVVQTAGKDGKYFVFSWTDSLTHDFLTSSSLIDDKIFNTLRWLEKGEYLNNTVFVLMSDHGLRHSKSYSNTYEGSIEIRMPMLYFAFPKWFQNQYQKGMRNLNQNSNMLSTHFDLHETLVDILYPGNITDKNIESRTNVLNTKDRVGITPRGISLFLPIPINRTCVNAGIGGNDCLCNEMREFSVLDPETLKAANALVKSINRHLVKFPKCSPQKLLKIYAAITPDIGYIKTLRITFSTNPGGATFQGTVLRVNKSKTAKPFWRLSGFILRTSNYHEHSHCLTIKDANAKPYCYCKSVKH